MLKIPRTLTTLLSYLGVLPFILGGILIYAGVPTLPVFGEVIDIIAVYGLVIAVFMSGVYWGQHLHIHKEWSIPLTILSNTNAIALWVGYIILPVVYFFVLLIFIFGVMYYIDYKLHMRQVITTEYITTRRNVTSIVLLNLIIMIFAL